MSKMFKTFIFIMIVEETDHTRDKKTINWYFIITSTSLPYTIKHHHKLYSCIKE